MEIAAKKLDIKIACEIFADRNYEDDGNLVSRKKPHALITDPEEARKHVLNMVKNQSLNCHSGKQIPCEIDSVCIHGDNERPLKVFNMLDAPHGHMRVKLNNVRVPKDNIILGPGRGFEISQGRLGPGRIHHCMRSIGAAEKALELLCQRAVSREAFGRPLYKLGGNIDIIADARMNIEQARLLTLKTAWLMDHTSPKEARIWISMIKTVVPNMTLKVVDEAIQMFGGIGVSQDTPLAEMWSGQRTLRLADGPDAVHRMVVGRNELKPYLADTPAVGTTFRDG